MCVCVLIFLSVTGVRKGKNYLLTLMNIYQQILNEYFTAEELLTFLLIRRRNNAALWMFLMCWYRGKSAQWVEFCPCKPSQWMGKASPTGPKYYLKLLQWCHIPSNKSESDKRPSPDLTGGSGSKGKAGRLRLVLHSVGVTRGRRRELTPTVSFTLIYTFLVLSFSCASGGHFIE